MSPQFLSRPVGRVALGVSLPWLATLVVAGGPETPAPAGAPSEAPPQSVLLLTNGHILEGQLSQDDAGYVLRKKLGTIRFPKRNVEGVFRSLDEAYQYKRGRIAEGDADEHLKLAQWCLAMKLEARAREQLQAVLALSPGRSEARAMLASLLAAQER